MRIKGRNITAEDVVKMKEAEAAGKTRSEIAREIGRDPSLVTRHLGAIRKYRKTDEEPVQS